MDGKTVLISILGVLFSFYALADAKFKPGEIVIKGKLPTSSSYTVNKYLPNANLTIIKVPPGKELAEVQKLKQKGRKAHVNLLANKFADMRDPYIRYQWSWNNIQAYQAWDINSGAGSTVAVLDTGIASNANDGVECVIAPTDIVNNDDLPEDGDGHGTHVSGTIAQASDNGAGVAGLAHSACIMPVKVLDDSGSGSFADIAEGIYYAVNNNAHVINMSLGVNAFYQITSDPIMDAALDYAYTKNVTVVAASGNDGSRKNVSYPAIYPTVIAVGATDINDGVVRYSNKGTGLDIVAPGGNTSVDLNGDGYVDGILQETRIDGNWGYYFLQGTSMASPHVAALAAMLISNQTASTPDQVKTALTETSKDLYEAGYDKTSGFGLIQSFDALNWDTDVPPLSSECTDNDGDGVCIEEGDCDDNNSAIYPGATDSRAKKRRDNIDNDCNGIIDG